MTGVGLARRVGVGLVKNSAYRVGVGHRLAAVGGGEVRGGVAWRSRPVAAWGDHVLRLYAEMKMATGDLFDCRGKTLLEIGPGDSIGVALCWLLDGAREVVLVDKLDSIRWDERHRALCEEVVRRLGTGPASARILADAWEGKRIRIEVARFEDFATADRVDMVYSHDVLPHVHDFGPVALAARRVLRPGGYFANRTYLGGTGDFEDPGDPLRFLTVPEGLWQAMNARRPGYNNRLRRREFIEQGAAHGLVPVRDEVLRRCEHGYVEALRGRLAARFRGHDDRDLEALDWIVVFQTERV